MLALQQRNQTKNQGRKEAPLPLQNWITNFESRKGRRGEREKSIPKKTTKGRSRIEKNPLKRDNEGTILIPSLFCASGQRLGSVTGEELEALQLDATLNGASLGSELENATHPTSTNVTEAPNANAPALLQFLVAFASTG